MIAELSGAVKPQRCEVNGRRCAIKHGGCGIRSRRCVFNLIDVKFVGAEVRKAIEDVSLLNKDVTFRWMYV